MAIAFDIIQKIKDEADIVGVISSYINLEKKGTSYWGICPFHPDTNPSLSVSPEKKIWKCFTCGASGNVFTFVSRFLKISFPEAVKIVAEKTGITIENNQEDEKTRLYRRYHNIMSDAKDFYSFYLKNTVLGSSAREYLKNRDLTDDIIEYFNIGLAPNSYDGLFKALTNNDTYLPSELAEVGLIKHNGEKDNYYDLFRHRIMFPVEDFLGNIVGFSARLYEKIDNEPKYINSNDNVIFKKGNILYNYYRAMNDIKIHDTVYLFEGFMDVIASYKAGIKNCVATMGTALTKNHINFIEKIAKKIVICYDGDNAGINATKKTIANLLTSSLEIEAVLIPDNQDPDEYLKKYGKEELYKILSRPMSAIDYLYNLEKNLLIKDDLSSCERFKENIFRYMKIFSSQTLNEALIKKLSLELNVSTQSILNDFNNEKTEVAITENIPPIIEKKEISQKRTIKKKYIKAENQIIAFAYQNKENSDYVSNLMSLGQCVEKEKRDILMKITDYYRDNELMNEEDFNKILSEDQLLILEKILEEPISNKSDIEIFANVVSEYQVEKKKEKVFREIKENEDKINLNKLNEFIKDRRKIIKIK